MISVLRDLAGLGLYLSQAGMLGILLHRLRFSTTEIHDPVLALVYAISTFLLGTLFHLARLAALPWLAGAVPLLAFALVWTCLMRPEWVPSSLWGRKFGHLYLASSMGLVALWGLGFAIRAAPASPERLASIFLIAAAGAAAFLLLRHKAPA